VQPTEEKHLTKQPSAKKRSRLSGPLTVGLCFALLAIVLSLLGLWRERNLSLYNVALAIVLGGGVWGLISWAIATAVVDVEEDVATREDSLPSRRKERREEKD
jgi:hypothetical protein